MNGVRLRLASLAAFAAMMCIPLPSRQMPSEESIKWIPDLEMAVKLAAKDNRKVLVDVYANWNGWCKIMHQRTYTNPAVVKYINARYYAVRLDGETQDTLRFQGQEFTYNPDVKMNQLAYLLCNGRDRYPTTVFLTGKSEVISPVVGYLPAPTMEKMLRFFADNYYLAQTWAEFSKGTE